MRPGARGLNPDTQGADNQGVSHHDRVRGHGDPGVTVIPMPPLRVMTYNVRQLRDDRSAVVRVLRAADPDVVAIQEPPRGPVGRFRLRRAAQAAGLVPVVSGGGARTTALLARPGLRVARSRGQRLPWHPMHTPRGLAVADIADVRVISVHLGLNAAERTQHVIRLLSIVRGAPGAGCVVAGDLNEQPTGSNWRRLCQVLHDLTATAGPTYSATKPAKRIDAVLATGGIVGSAAHVIADEAGRRGSDHLPLVVDLWWP